MGAGGSSPCGRARQRPAPMRRSAKARKHRERPKAREVGLGVAPSFPISKRLTTRSLHALSTSKTKTRRSIRNVFLRVFLYSAYRSGEAAHFAPLGAHCAYKICAAAQGCGALPRAPPKGVTPFGNPLFLLSRITQYQRSRLPARSVPPEYTCWYPAGPRFASPR